MSIISNNDPYEAIESAIKSASDEICRKVDLKKFDPWAKGDPLTPSSHDFCGQFFDGRIKKMNHRILKNQNMPDVISYSGTRGWLYGYSCAQEKAKPVIKKLQETQCNLNKKTEEADKLEVKLENKTDQFNKLKSTDKGKLYRKLQWAKCCCLCLVVALALVIILSS